MSSAPTTASAKGGPCDNPLCSCDPCGCTDCRCGATSLGALERRIMEIFWTSRGEEWTARAVCGELGDHAYTTVATVLDRLVKKDLLTRRKVGRAYRFTAVGSTGSHTAVLMHEALCKGHDDEAALVRFAETLSDEQAAVLRDALERSQR